MPEAAVDEDSHPRPSEDKIGTHPPTRKVHTHVDAIA